MSVQSAVTFAIAVLGAVLGIINTWQALRRDRLRIRVRPINAITEHGHWFGVEVVNLSQFAVTIEEVGFTLGRRSAKRGNRLAVLSPVLIDNGPWPRRLEPRSSVTIYFDPRGLESPPSSIARAYARTACNEFAYGSTPALENLRQLTAST